MKKIILCLLIILIYAPVFSQEESPEPAESAGITELAELAEPVVIAMPFQWYDYPWNLGISAEAALNSRERATPGFGVSLDRYLFTPHVALGLRGAMYNDAKSVTATEAQITLRLYFPEFKKRGSAFFFAQWGFGAAFYSEEDRRINSYLLDMTAGLRIYGNKALYRFYVEPYARAGFPFLFSAGLSAGRRFDL
jgi:hypothetical protein